MVEERQGPVEGGIKIVNSGGCYDCGGRCVLKIHVKDGKAVRVESDEGEEPQIRACLRGRAMRKQVQSPDRLLYPQRRVGERGEGRFERISWDEALDSIAGELTRIKENHGPKAILALTLSGGIGSLHTGNLTVRQLLRSFGGYTSAWGDDSAEGSVFAARATYGTLFCGNTRDDLVNSKLILVWGANPATSIFGTNTSYYLIKARETGAKIVVIDPRYTNTAAVLADEWIPVRPGTDSAMMAAMAYVMIKEGLHNADFLARHTVGFDRYRDYVLGGLDGVAKTPDWAEEITGVPGSRIAELARKYATIKPAALLPGFAPGRTAFGEQFHRAAATLAAMTGNVGVSGGGAGGFDRPLVGPMVPIGFAKYFEGGPRHERIRQLNVPGRLSKQPHACRLWDAILEGKAGGYPEDYRMAYIAFNNPLNQYPNINKGTRALRKLDFIVVHEQFMTPTARFADILLPVTTVWERNDFTRPWLGGSYFLYQNKAVEPPGEARSDFDICKDLAKRLGVENPLFETSEGEAVRQLVESAEDVIPEIPDWEKFKQDGVHKIQRPGPTVAFKQQVKGEGKEPFPTLSGKIEIYSDPVNELGNPELPPFPSYVPAWEGPGDELTRRFPLQLITIHHKTRAHSCFDNNPWLKDVEPQSLWINATDAEERGISDGEDVRVFNDRGETIIRAGVTERIMPGVVSLGQGAWYSPDASGRDRAGSPNVLTRDDYSPGGAFPFNTALVQVERFVEEG
ncbi:MAG: molybdopterin-dependent oxidoreductase [Desulfosalsimonadaceae bacterium]